MLYAGLIGDLQDKAERAFFDLEITTKNLTNISTPGYKAERAFTFDEALDKVQKYMEPGGLVMTGRKNDVSLEGKGFFALKDKNDKTVLTRNLTLGQDKDGNLTSGEYIVVPKTSIPGGFSGYEIEQDGAIHGKKPDGTKIKFASLEVLNFPAPEKLDFDGFVYKPTEQAGKPLTVCLGPIGQTKVRQGTQEGSNVDTPLEFAQFSETNQKIQTLQRLNALLNTSEKQYIQSLTGLI
jgi:flagellar basal body rod protein FlgG